MHEHHWETTHTTFIHDSQIPAFAAQDISEQTALRLVVGFTVIYQVCNCGDIREQLVTGQYSQPKTGA
jgi:hypothetical protein